MPSEADYMKITSALPFTT